MREDFALMRACIAEVGGFGLVEVDRGCMGLVVGCLGVVDLVGRG